jgi:hypothetical protein
MSNPLNSTSGRNRKAGVRNLAKQMTKIFAALSPREESSCDCALESVLMLTIH